MKTIVIMEISKKQHYIFKTNKLKHHIGGSAIIRYISEQIGEDVKACHYETYGGELIYQGGGNSLYLFDAEADADTFIEQFSKYILKEYPSIELFMTKTTYDVDQKSIIDVMGTLYEGLAKKKTKREGAYRMMDHGVELICKESKCPINQEVYDGEGKIGISQEIRNKLEFAKKDSEIFEDIYLDGYNFIKDFEFNGNNNKNVIAVVHIDGNNMGQKILAIKEKYSGKDVQEINENYLEDLKGFSSKIDKSYKEAFMKMCEALVKEADGDVLPIRPLVLAGDDVCFVTKGELGIEASRLYLEELAKMVDIAGNPLYACAGVAIVKHNYPFYRAYKLSEELCSNAKTALLNEESVGSVIDWHISYGEINGSLSDIRDKDYGINDKESLLSLTSKPYQIVENTKGIRGYDDFIDAMRMINNLQPEGEDTGSARRGIIKEYRSSIKKGNDAVEHFRIKHKLNDQLAREFVNGCSRSFDYIEVMDVFKRMEG